MGSKINEIKNSPEEKRIQQELKDSANYTVLVWSLVGLGVIAIVVLFVFVFAHPWHFTLCADSAQWGQYGDFIGGFLGTIVAFLSVYYLIQTLREQIRANRQVMENNLTISNVNYLQQVDTKICHLIEFYKEVRDSYKDKSPKHQTLNEEVALLKEKTIKTDENYKNRLLSANEMFDKEFYVQCKPIAAVQFRVLYQIMCLIKTIDDKNDDIKLFYGKMVRSQLSEDELILLRYNCQCKYGIAMREHICRFNLLKHLPPLSLLEFQYWTKHILNDEILQNAMDTELIAERKEIIKKSRNINLQNKDEGYFISNKYHLYMDFSHDRNEFVYRLIRKNNYPEVEHIDWAYSKLGDNHMINFIKDFLHEVFEYSNFQKYNKGLEYLPLNSKPEYNADNQETIFNVIVRTTEKDTKIVINYEDYLEKDPKAEIIPIDVSVVKSDKLQYG
jgi:hypothetical protein